MASEKDNPAPGDARRWRFTALTDIWTGDLKGEPRRLITTGLLGSVRWWFEILVRGLGGSACDPSKTKCQDRKRCVVCELFGCTGWARKFRFDVLGASREPQCEQIKKDVSFQLSFTPLRPVGNEEWALLDVTLRLVAEYGAIGGKTVYKPSDENGRENAQHHRDYGLVRIDASPVAGSHEEGLLRAYVTHARWQRPNHGNFAWASLEHFWAVPNRYLARENGSTSAFNRVIGRAEPKNGASQDSWLAGTRAGNGRDPASKKVLSFKAPARTFGFLNPNELSLDDMKGRLRSAWQDLADDEVRVGGTILRELLGGRSP